MERSGNTGVLFIFELELLNLKYLGWSYRAYMKIAKNGDICEEFFNENDFEAALATFCYHYGAKASGVVQKIATDQKEYC